VDCSDVAERRATFSCFEVVEVNGAETVVFAKRIGNWWRTMRKSPSPMNEQQFSSFTLKQQLALCAWALNVASIFEKHESTFSFRDANLVVRPQVRLKIVTHRLIPSSKCLKLCLAYARTLVYLRERKGLWCILLVSMVDERMSRSCTMVEILNGTAIARYHT
jgi:hypothetical protein